MSFDVDADVQDGLKAASAAADQDKIAGITASKPTSEVKYVDPIDDWMLNLPKNVTVGVMDAARNTVNSVNAFGTWLDGNLKDKERAYREQGIEGAGPPAPSAQELRMRSMEQGASAGADDLNPFNEHHAFGQQFAAFRDELAKGSSMSDSITQGIAQFAIPMLGWSKALGAQKAISLAGFGAEAATASTALDPHSGRTADLFALGRSVEGKFGQTLQDISPDGSALNAYINYMTDRSNEGVAEGRFKNVVDSMVSSVAGAALLKTGATTIKVAQNLPAYVADNAGVPRVGPSAQVGAVGDLSRPPLRQGVDPAESIYQDQARRDAEAAAAAPPGTKRPPLRQGVDPADPIYRQQVRQDVDTAHRQLDPNLESAAPQGWGTIEGGGATPEDGSSLNSAPGTKAFSSVLQTSMDNPHGAPLSKLSSALQEHLPNDAEGDFYKEVLQRVAANNPETKVFTHSEPYSHPVNTNGLPKGNTHGLYRRTDDTLHLYPGAFRNPARLTQVFTHEAVHAVTVKTLDNSPRVYQDFQQLARQASDSAAPQGDTSILSKADQYGFKNPHEFVAEIESNPRFRQAMQNTRPLDANGNPAQSGPTVWDLYKDKIAGILGVGGVAAASPLFEKLLSQEKPGA